MQSKSTPGTGDYRAYADAGMTALQQWYNQSSGLWNSTGWWNSANALGALIDYSARTGVSSYKSAISNTFDKNSKKNFINNFYDDEGWWSLTWINAYDLLLDTNYLTMAETIFADMTGGWDNSTCNGGIWWSKDRKYKNAIANELFFTIAIRLHQRTSDKVGSAGNVSYLDWANRSWTWFLASGMINAAHLVNDGLDGSCKNNGQTTWTYNQGVILGGLVDMYKVSGDAAYLTQAETIADAAITTLVNANGILVEPCEPNCGNDGPQFKGIFMRNLWYLYDTDNNQSYRDFITRNADSIWLNDRNAANQFGLMWTGPFDKADAARQSSALDALNAAVPFTVTGNM